MQTEKLKPLPFGAVELTDAYCKNALQKETDYLLSLEEGRLLAGFYENAGLKTPYVRYGGWESGLIGGHTLGHFLSALSQGSANAGVPAEDRARLFKKVRAVVDGLAECQRHSKGKRGFLWGAPAAAAGYPEAQFDNVERGKTNIKREAWVPWYTMHKILSGLLDAYEIAGYAPALAVASALGDWVCDRTGGWDKRVRRKVLAVEYGGMNDVLYRLYAATGKAEYARAAHLFDEDELFFRLLEREDNALEGLHANTTISKFIGALNRYRTLHGKVFDGKTVDASRYFEAAKAFFRVVSERHTYVTGGNSEWEHFGADYVLDAKRTNCNCETCNAYNMLKLARMLFSLTGDVRYTDFYDNAFTDSILASQNPETGMTTYFQPMASGFFKVFSRPYDKFWCCTGSGMESFTKLGDSAVYSDGDDLYLEQYLSAVVRSRGIVLETECGFPFSDRAYIGICAAPRPFRLFLRLPDWADGEPELTKNGEKIPLTALRGHTFVWVNEGDRLCFRIPVGVSLKGLPDGGALAFRYGGATLCADLGTEDMRETETGVDVCIPARRSSRSDVLVFPDLAAALSAPENLLVREGETFRLQGADKPLEFCLYNRRYRERYAVYLRFTEGGEERREAAEPLDVVQAGYGQYESDALHDLLEKNSVGVAAGETYRYARAGGWFSYDFLVDPHKRNVLSVPLLRKENGKTLKIRAGDVTIFEGTLMNTMDEGQYRREFEIPASALAAAREKTVNGETRTVLRIRFSGHSGRTSAKICGFIRLYVK